MLNQRLISRSTAVLAIYIGFFAFAVPAWAIDYQGTVSLEGTVNDSLVGGLVPLEEIEVSVDPASEPTGKDKCSTLNQTADLANIAGVYPSVGVVSAEVLIEGNGNKEPEGACILKVKAHGDDGVSVSVRGTSPAYPTKVEIGGNQTMTGIDIILRQSKIVAGASKDCLKWVKKQIKLRAKCNSQLLKLGPDYALRCKDADAEPLDCDLGQHVEAILVLSHGLNDQQTASESAELLVDAKLLKDQINCQKGLGKAAAKFVAKQTKLIQKKCIEQGLDSVACRGLQVAASRKKLDIIDKKCTFDVASDAGTGRDIPQIGGVECASCITAGVIDQKCLKSCFEGVLASLSDGILGDTPVCGNGVIQNPEICDDDNVANGDCCSDACVAEPAGSQTCGFGICEVTVAECSSGAPVDCTPGTPEAEGGATCADGLDNDCDGFVDLADGDCP
jgi:cysteine-rich repeat protein